MKKLIAAAALVVALASPALAQAYDPDLGSGNIVRWGYSHAHRGAYHAFARVHHRRHSQHR